MREDSKYFLFWGVVVGIKDLMDKTDSDDCFWKHFTCKIKREFVGENRSFLVFVGERLPDVQSSTGFHSAYGWICKALDNDWIFI